MRSSLARRIHTSVSFIYVGFLIYSIFNYTNNVVFLMPASYHSWLMTGNAPGPNNPKSVCEVDYTQAGIVEIDMNAYITPEEIISHQPSQLTSGGKYSPNCLPRQRIAIILPFRNRTNHLNRFFHFLHPFLQKQNVHYQIFVVEQMDDQHFNRGMLLNIGAQYALKARPMFDCFIFHDVDVYPENELNLYECEPSNLRNLASAMDEWRYHSMYYNQASTVIAISRTNLLKINGFSNLYWGWGGEDDDFTMRCLYGGMLISKPPFHIGRFKMARHVKSWRTDNSHKLLRRWYGRSKTEGLNSLDKLSFKIVSTSVDRLHTRLHVTLGDYPAEQIKSALQHEALSEMWFLRFYIP